MKKEKGPPSLPFRISFSPRTCRARFQALPLPPFCRARNLGEVLILFFFPLLSLSPPPPFFLPSNKYGGHLSGREHRDELRTCFFPFPSPPQSPLPSFFFPSLRRRAGKNSRRNFSVRRSGGRRLLLSPFRIPLPFADGKGRRRKFFGDGGVFRPPLPFFSFFFIFSPPLFFSQERPKRAAGIRPDARFTLVLGIVVLIPLLSFFQDVHAEMGATSFWEARRKSLPPSPSPSSGRLSFPSSIRIRR